MQNSPKAFQKATLNKPGGQFSFLFKRKMLGISLKWRLCQKSDVYFKSAFNFQEATVLGAAMGAGAHDERWLRLPWVAPMHHMGESALHSVCPASVVLSPAPWVFCLFSSWGCCLSHIRGLGINWYLLSALRMLFGGW